MSTQEEEVVENLKKKLITDNIIGKNLETVIAPKPLERKKRKASGANPLASLKANDDSNASKKKKINKFKRS